ncbi:MAG: xanthine dehydrogenase family protein subunit M [Armatimonadetes bacterium]|nr:xanthine dehydrogenase family protein subunit M [Armatimonadota bacterium]MDW8122991.1 xanthine dehydrogenase family protein subunit M [Armatimonadota bacterium]
MHSFDYRAPKDLEETLEEAAHWGEKGRLLAGGTDLILFMERGRLRPEVVIEVPRTEPFTTLEETNGMIRIGARVTMGQLEHSPLIREKLPVLSQAAGEVGSVQIRNLATIGGNIVTASPAGDTLPALLVLDAQLMLQKKGSLRTVPIDQFFLGPGQTVREPDEVLTEVRVPVKGDRFVTQFYKLAVRSYMDIAIVDVAIGVYTNGDGAVEDARIALGSVAPTPIRAREAEERLKGQVPTETLIDEVALLAQKASSPITDQRGSAEYRWLMVYRLTKRLLTNALLNSSASGHR